MRIAAGDPGGRERSAGCAVGRIRGAVLGHGQAVDCAGDAAAGDAAPGLLLVAVNRQLPI